MKKHHILAGLMVMAMTITGCSGTDNSGDDDGRPMHEHYDNPGSTAAAPEDAMPYGAGYEHLANAAPQDVATAALTALGEVTASQVDSGTAVDVLNGVVTGNLWSQLSQEQSAVVPAVTGPAWRAWADAGGTQSARVSVDGEQHPEDTPTTWARKIAVTRDMAGQNVLLQDSYIVECEKVSGQWRVSGLELLSTTSLQREIDDTDLSGENTDEQEG